MFNEPMLSRFLREMNKTNGFEKCFENISGASCNVDEGDASLWWVGVIVSIIGSILSNFGVNTQKYSMIKEIRASQNRPYIKQPIWMLGLLMVFLGAVADFGALGFAAQSLITPVGGFTMVANLFFAHYWLGESITRLDFGSTALIISGIALVAAFADKSSQCFTVDSLKCLYRRSQFIAYAVMIGATIIAFYIIVRYVRRKVEQMKEKDETSSKSYSRLRTVYPLLCASLSGLIGAQSVLFAKSTIEILKSAFRGNPEFAHFETYLIIIAMLIAIFGQIHWLAVGLKEFDAVIMVPVFQCVFVVFTIIGGGAYFAEFRTFNKMQTIMFPVGVLVLVLGVLGLALHQSRTAEELLDDGSVATSGEDLEVGKVLGVLESSDRRNKGKLASTNVSTNSLSPTEVQAMSFDPETAVDENRGRGRSSVSRYDEFNRLLPYGAVTGRFTPALLLWNEVDFHRNHSHPHLPGGGGAHGSGPLSSFSSFSLSRFRRSSVPHRQSSHQSGLAQAPDEPQLVARASLKSGREKAVSFAGIEHLLSTSQRTLEVVEDSSSSDEEDDDSAVSEVKVSTPPRLARKE